MADNSAASVGTFSQPKYWEKTTYDTKSESMFNARDVGYVRKNYSRLNIVSALSAEKNDSEDWFKFNVLSKGKMRLSIRTDAVAEGSEKDAIQEDDYGLSELEKVIDSYRAKGLRIEVYSKKGKKMEVYASNDDKSGEAYKRFENLIRGEENIKQTGNYYLKISRVDGSKASKEDINYIVQMQMGDQYKHDYATIEKPIQKDKLGTKSYENIKPSYQGLLDGITQSSLLLNIQAANSMLEAGGQNMANIRTELSAKASGIVTLFNFKA